MSYTPIDLNNLFIKRSYKRNRVSSYAKDDSNNDRISFMPNKSKIVANIKGPAVITHF